LGVWCDGFPIMSVWSSEFGVWDLDLVGPCLGILGFGVWDLDLVGPCLDAERLVSLVEGKPRPSRPLA
jgi:hypothetical protein